jgi:tetratricopeptide (TPR) repeat protein
MRLRNNLLLFFSLIFFVGCSFTPNELKTAEQVMDSKPDSALHVLERIKFHDLRLNSDRALYGVLLFQALDKKDKPLPPDSLIDFSINYYLNQNDKAHLASCYYYKGRISLVNQRYDNAINSYLKALDCVENKRNCFLLGKIYADIGDVCSVQHNYKEALKKYMFVLDCFNNERNTKDKAYALLRIGRTYRLLNNYNKAREFYSQVPRLSKDSILYGVLFQEMGINYYQNKQFDSAQFYLKQSLHFPFKTSNYSIRCYFLADLFFEKAKYDSANLYALIALKYPANFFTQRECYRILVNVEYLRKDIKQMGKYMGKYQNYSDSIRKVESQTKSTVLENLHNTSIEAKGTKRNMNFVISILAIVLILSSFIVYFLYRRNKLKRTRLELFKQQLSEKQEFVSLNLSKKIEETKASQLDMRKNALPQEKIRLNKEMYNSILHLDDWPKFKQEMNHTFNQIVDRLELDYSGISKREIIWCCLQLLDIPNADKMLLLDITTNSLYKLKQRLAQKMSLESTKDLDSFLRELVMIRN